jgi:hypothetical protein
LTGPKSRNSVSESGNSVDGPRKAERLLKSKVGISGKTSKSPNFFLKVVPGAKIFQKIFQKFFKNKVFGPLQMLKNTFFEFFSSIVRVFVPVSNAKKWSLSDLVPVLNPKGTIFSHLILAQTVPLNKRLSSFLKNRF